jgi:hypothetical protein
VRPALRLLPLAAAATAVAALVAVAAPAPPAGDSAVVTAGAPAEQATAGTPPEVVSPCDPATVPAGPGDPQLSVLAQDAFPVARADPHYAGIAIDQVAGKVDVFLTPGGEGVAATLLGMLDDRGRVNWVARTYDHLLALQRQVGDDLAWFAGIGLEVVRWGPDLHFNALEVGVRTFTDPHARAVAERYGDGVRLCGPEAPLTLFGSHWAQERPRNAVAG